jgi:hypothetical protein
MIDTSRSAALWFELAASRAGTKPVGTPTALQPAHHQPDPLKRAHPGARPGGWYHPPDALHSRRGTRTMSTTTDTDQALLLGLVAAAASIEALALLLRPLLALTAGHRALARSGRRAQLLEVLA